jgi:hypothetical protein
LGKKKKRQAGGTTPKRSKQTKELRETRSKYPFVALAAGVILLAIGTYYLSQGEKSLKDSPGDRKTTADIPSPLGGPSVAVDVNTMIGKKGPSFTLRDGNGRAYAVTPGKGRPLVIISHMGYD